MASRIIKKIFPKKAIVGNHPILHILAIIIIGAGIYANCLTGQFIWDDEILIKNNPHIRSWSNAAEIISLRHSGGGCKYYYRPLTAFTYIIDYSFWKLDPRGYHLINILLHILVTLCVYWLIRILHHGTALPFLAALFFLIHPVQASTVAYISNRINSLVSLFMMLCFIFYVKYTDSKNIRIFFAMLLTYALALLSKENSLIMPLALIVYNHTFRKKISIPGFYSIVFMALAYAGLRFAFCRAYFSGPLLNAAIYRAPAFFVAVTNYVLLLLAPINLSMGHIYRNFSFFHPKAISGFFIMGCSIAYALRNVKKSPFISFSILWFFVMLLPASNLYPLYFYMTDHYLYLSSLGFFTIVAGGLLFLYKRIKPDYPVKWIIVIVLAAYAHLAYRQNNYWNNPVSFFERTIKFNSSSSELYRNLGLAYAKEGRYPEAVKSYKKALELNPHNPLAYANLGTSYAFIQDKDSAINAYKKALELDPNMASVYNNLGTVYVNSADITGAIEMYKKCLKMNPLILDAYYNLGKAYDSIGKEEEAIAILNKSLAIDNDFLPAHYELMGIYKRRKQQDLFLEHEKIVYKSSRRRGFKPGAD